MPDILRRRVIERMKAELETLRAGDQFSDLTTATGIQLSSNDYLALSSNLLLREAIQRAVAEHPKLASTGSRLISGNSEAWEQVERQFAQFLNVEAALYFPSGYAANMGLLGSILKPGDTVFSDSANHASLIDGIRLSKARRVVFPHLDLNYLEDALRRDSGGGEKVIVVESIFSMDGDHAPLGDLIKLCDRYGASLIVDEAHSVGVEGEHGRGAVDAIGRHDCILATIHPCGKALAAMGAFVAGSQTLRDFLINHARTFIFSTALPPYCAVHVREALELAAAADRERSHLKELSSHLRKGLTRAGVNVRASDSQIIPLVLGSNEAALRSAEALNAAGFAVRAIRPPTVPAGSARLRISLNAALSFEDLDAFADVFTRSR